MANNASPSVAAVSAARSVNPAALSKATFTASKSSSSGFNPVAALTASNGAASNAVAKVVSNAALSRSSFVPSSNAAPYGLSAPAPSIQNLNRTVSPARLSGSSGLVEPNLVAANGAASNAPKSRDIGGTGGSQAISISKVSVEEEGKKFQLLSQQVGQTTTYALRNKVNGQVFGLPNNPSAKGNAVRAEIFSVAEKSPNPFASATVFSISRARGLASAGAGDASLFVASLNDNQVVDKSKSIANANSNIFQTAVNYNKAVNNQSIVSTISQDAARINNALYPKNSSVVIKNVIDSGKSEFNNATREQQVNNIYAAGKTSQEDNFQRVAEQVKAANPEPFIGDIGAAGVQNIGGFAKIAETALKAPVIVAKDLYSLGTTGKLSNSNILETKGNLASLTEVSPSGIVFNQKQNAVKVAQAVSPIEALKSSVRPSSEIAQGLFTAAVGGLVLEGFGEAGKASELESAAKVNSRLVQVGKIQSDLVGKGVSVNDAFKQAALDVYGKSKTEVELAPNAVRSQPNTIASFYEVAPEYNSNVKESFLSDLAKSGQRLPSDSRLPSFLEPDSVLRQKLEDLYNSKPSSENKFVPEQVIGNGQVHNGVLTDALQIRGRSLNGQVVEVNLPKGYRVPEAATLSKGNFLSTTELGTTTRSEGITKFLANEPERLSEQVYGRNKATFRIFENDKVVRSGELSQPFGDKVFKISRSYKKLAQANELPESYIKGLVDKGLIKDAESNINIGKQRLPNSERLNNQVFVKSTGGFLETREGIKIPFKVSGVSKGAAIYPQEGIAISEANKNPVNIFADKNANAPYLKIKPKFSETEIINKNKLLTLDEQLKAVKESNEKAKGNSNDNSKPPAAPEKPVPPIPEKYLGITKAGYGKAGSGGSYYARAAFREALSKIEPPRTISSGEAGRIGGSVLFPEVSPSFVNEPTGRGGSLVPDFKSSFNGYSIKANKVSSSTSGLVGLVQGKSQTVKAATSFNKAQTQPQVLVNKLAESTQTGQATGQATSFQFQPVQLTKTQTQTLTQQTEVQRSLFRTNNEIPALNPPKFYPSGGAFPQSGADSARLRVKNFAVRGKAKNRKSSLFPSLVSISRQQAKTGSLFYKGVSLKSGLKSAIYRRTGGEVVPVGEQLKEKGFSFGRFLFKKRKGQVGLFNVAGLFVLLLFFALSFDVQNMIPNFYLSSAATLNPSLTSGLSGIIIGFFSFFVLVSMFLSLISNRSVS